jgi:NADPH:quinone reductase-like Zn-dependent oxidoreductase
MKQVVIPKRGGPEVLEVRESPDLQAKDGQVRIKVSFAGLNFADVSARLGLYPDAPPKPCTVGYEVSGVIDQIGAGVTGVKEGQRVLALTRFNGQSSMVVVPTVQIVALPDSISFERAAAIPVTYLTAWLMLVHHANVRAGDKVLVHAAAGGVGTAAVQIAKSRGAEIFGTASASKHDRLKKMGVAHCIDYHTQDFEEEIKTITNGRGVDVILDAIGGESWKKGYRSLAPLGRLFCFGGASAQKGDGLSITALLKFLFGMPKFKPMQIMGDNKGVFGVNLGHLWDQSERLGAMMKEIVDQVDKGVLDPVVDKIFSFEEAAEAHKFLSAGKNFGKVLLKP